MKKIIKEIIPALLLEWYRKWASNLKTSKFVNMSTKETFTEIYKTNFWSSNESPSGGGSELIQTKSLINDLEKLLKDMDIKSVLDIPCGDFNWMQKS